MRNSAKFEQDENSSAKEEPHHSTAALVFDIDDSDERILGYSVIRNRASAVEGIQRTNVTPSECEPPSFLEGTRMIRVRWRRKVTASVNR
jgi:hypothetical protein